MCILIFSYLWISHEFHKKQLKTRLLETAFKEFELNESFAGDDDLNDFSDVLKSWKKATGYELISFKGTINSEIIKNHTIFILQDNSTDLGGRRCALAYSPEDNHIFSLVTQYSSGSQNREDWLILNNVQHLIKSETKSKVTEPIAREIVDLFLKLYDIDRNFKLLKDSQDIELPKDDFGENIPIPSDIQQTIRPLEVEAVNDKYILTFFTWGGPEGILKEWKFIVEKDGTINFEIISSRKEIGRTYYTW